MLTEDWLQFRAVVTPAFLGRYRTARVAAAKDLLHDLLVRLFGEPSIARLCAAEPTAPFACRVATELNVLVAQRRWKRTTAQPTLHVVKAMLSKTKVAAPLLRAIRLLPQPARHNVALGRKYGALDTRDPTRQMLEGWLRHIAVRRPSAASQRNIMIFLLRQVLPALGYRPEDLPCTEGLRELRELRETLRQRLTPEVVRALCHGATSSSKWFWLQIFVREILQCPWQPDKGLAQAIRQQQRLHDEVAKDTDDGRDHHRIATGELEQLYLEACKDPLDELFFLTLLTTGMRIAAFAQIKCANVAELRASRWEVREQGSTVEKGRKPLVFPLEKRVRELFSEWLNTHRSVDLGPYAFPGKCGSHISTTSLRLRFRRMCEAAHLAGSQFHPHALRHCFVHILSELGNPLELVGRLICHTRARTTQQYYLRESASETVARANIPWMSDEEQRKRRPNPVPSFLVREPCTKDLTASLYAFAERHA
jgi:integrase